MCGVYHGSIAAATLLREATRQPRLTRFDRLLKLPGQIGRHQDQMVCRVITLQRSRERSPTIAEWSVAGVKKLPRRTRCDIAVDFILNTSGVAQLAIKREGGEAIRFRHRRTVIRE